MNEMYFRIDTLCRERGSNVTSMCKELHITRTILSELKSGRTKEISDSIVQKIADYFNVHSDYIRCKTDIRKNPYEAMTGIEELIKTASELNDANYKKLLEYGELLVKSEKFAKEEK